MKFRQLQKLPGDRSSKFVASDASGREVAYLLKYSGDCPWQCWKLTPNGRVDDETFQHVVARSKTEALKKFLAL